MRVKLEPSKSLLRVLTVNKVKVVKSFEFYNYVGLKYCNYSRWMQDTVFNIGEKGKDYWASPDNIEAKWVHDRINDKYRYFFTLDFAISICRVVRRNEAMQLIELLKQEAREEK